MSIKFLNLDKTLPVEKIRSTRPIGYKFPVGLSTFASGASNVATNTTGGTQTIDGTNAVHSFASTGSNTFAPSFDGTIEVLVVAGGGAGGAAGGAGGGAGGLIYNSAYSVTSGSPITVVVGAGGTAVAGPRPLPSGTSKGTPGSNTSFDSLVAVYGGAGSGRNAPASGAEPADAGGSGGGGMAGVLGGASIQGPSGFGFAGGPGNPSGPSEQHGAGGGAGGTGGPADGSAVGGIGLEYSISGAPVGYAGGGGAGSRFGTGGTASQGGGAGGPTGTGNGTAGTSNRGGGGGGGGNGPGPTNNGGGGSGGSGVVIVRYVANQSTTDFIID